MAHSRFGGSVMARIMACPGSVKLSEGEENKTSEYAAEGTMLHDMAASILWSWWTKVPLTEDFIRVHGKLDDDQKSVLTEYVNTVRTEVDMLDMDDESETLASLMVEQGFSIPLHPEFTGTADAVIWNNKSVRVIDLKCGRGVDVQADYNGDVNPQLAFYLLGVLSALGFSVLVRNGIVQIRSTEKAHEGIDDLEVIIVQPRNGGVKRRKVTFRELENFAAQALYFAKRADTEFAELASGPHCKFCLAKHKCPELRKAAFMSAKEDFEPPSVPDMTPDELAKALSQADIMELWIKAVRERADVLAIQKGTKIPGYKVVERLGNRTWIDEDTVLDMLAIDHKIPRDELVTSKVLSPAQMEKTLKRHAMPPKWVDDMTERKASLVLVGEGDKRPEVKTGAAKDFEDFTS